MSTEVTIPFASCSASALSRRGQSLSRRISGENDDDLVGNTNRTGNVFLCGFADDKEVFIAYHLDAVVPQPQIELIDALGVEPCVTQENRGQMSLFWSVEFLEDRCSIAMQDFSCETAARAGADQAVGDAVPVPDLEFPDSNLQRLIKDAFV